MVSLSFSRPALFAFLVACIVCWTGTSAEEDVPALATMGTPFLSASATKKNTDRRAQKKKNKKDEDDYYYYDDDEEEEDEICFSAENTVDVKDVGMIPIPQLKIGDYVKVSNGKYSQVYGYGHFDHEKVSSFVHVAFEDSTVLELSADHLVFTSVGKVMTADSIQVGDSLMSDSPQGQPRIVQSIDEVTRRGVYAPLTKSGDIVVSGVRASNFIKMLDHYASWPNDHQIGVTYMYPYKVYCSLFPKSCEQTMYTQGYCSWAYVLVKVGAVLKLTGRFAYSCVWLVSIPLFAIVYVLQSTMATFAVLGLSVYMYTRYRRQQKE